MSKRWMAVCVALLAVRCAAAAESTQPPASGSVKNVVINAEVVRKRLPVAGSALGARTELVLRNIRFEVHPGTQFHVVLERHDDPAKRARVGTLSFYATGKGPVTTSRTFDVTDELRQIASSADDLKNVDIVFEATSGRGGEKEASFDPDVKLTVGQIEVRVKK